MGIPINSKSSGFRKWAEIHQPTTIDKSRAAADEHGVVAAAIVDRVADTSNLQPHRPWLVPGVGRL